MVNECAGSIKRRQEVVVIIRTNKSSTDYIDKGLFSVPKSRQDNQFSCQPNKLCGCLRRVSLNESPVPVIRSKSKAIQSIRYSIFKFLKIDCKNISFLGMSKSHILLNLLGLYLLAITEKRLLFILTH